jgi:uncharacterized protein YehS (DUF1456 family)
LKINDDQMAKTIALTGIEANPAQVKRWLLREDANGFQELSDPELCQFLDGLIIEKRGPHPDGSTPEPLRFLSTNEILKKLRIALALRDDEMLAIFKRADFSVTKAELGSFFRKEGQRNFSKCPEQVLRKFILGLGKAKGEKK